MENISLAQNSENEKKENIKRLRKGVMGGTFDPIHNGHIMIAKCAYEQLGLNEVLFLPAGDPPHKKFRSKGATNAQRLAMTELAIRGYPQFLLDDQEMRRDGPSYTKDTLLNMKKNEPDTEFYFIIGADSLMEFDTWFHPEIICANCTLVVAGRGGLQKDVLENKISGLKASYGASAVIMDLQEMEVSSSDLRRKCSEKHSIRRFVPEAVADYIEKNGIYGS